MRRCLHILPMNKLSGAEKMVLILCRNLHEYDPVVVCGGDNLKSIFQENGIKSYTLNFSVKNIINILRTLIKIIREENIKIIHAHDNIASIVAYLVKKVYRLDLKIVSHIHSCYPWLKGSNLNMKIDRFFRSRYDCNVTCGKLVYDYYKDNANYFIEEKSFILSNAIDIDEVTNVNVSKVQEVIKEFNIPRNKTILGFVGRICEIKGIIPFIKEFAKYREDFEDCIVLLIGSGDQDEEVKQLIRTLDLEDFFILVGFQKDTYKFYPIIDILFLPSLYEGLPMVLLEAMAFKKTIVAMDVGGISEIIKDSYNGYLIEKENYKNFIIKIKDVKNNKMDREKIGENSFRYIKDKYDIEQYVKSIITIYDSFIL